MNLVVGDTIRALSSHHGLLLIQKPTGTIDRGGKTHMIIEEILQVSAFPKCWKRYVPSKTVKATEKGAVDDSTEC